MFINFVQIIIDRFCQMSAECFQVSPNVELLLFTFHVSSCVCVYGLGSIFSIVVHNSYVDMFLYVDAT